MKKLISGMVLSALVAPAFGAPVPVASEKMTFGDTIASWFDGTWYGGIRGELSFLNWKNEYSASDVDVDGRSDKYSMEPVFGGSLSFGHMFNENWRGEVEAGMIGRFTDSGYGADFELTIPYMSLNVMYDFTEPQVQGLYVGGGLGFALPKLDFDTGAINIQERAVSPMFALMVGYSYEMSENVSLDLRYRLSALFGPDGKENNVNDFIGEYFEVDTGFILDNSISLGLRYEF